MFLKQEVKCVKGKCLGQNAEAWREMGVVFCSCYIFERERESEQIRCEKIFVAIFLITWCIFKPDFCLNSISICQRCFHRLPKPEIVHLKALFPIRIKIDVFDSILSFFPFGQVLRFFLAVFTHLQIFTAVGDFCS